MATEHETPEALRAEIEHLRRLGYLVTDERVRAEIQKMIAELEERLGRLQQGSLYPPATMPIRSVGFLNGFLSRAA